MTFNEIAAAINERNAAENAETGNSLITSHSVNSWLDNYQLSVEQAARIAERADSLSEFEAIWENETWWA